eukprot:gene10831-3451_t
MSKELNKFREDHGPYGFHSSHDIRTHQPEQEKKHFHLKDTLKEITSFISTESVSNLDGLEIDFEPEEILMKGYQFHKDSFNRWIQHFCVLTEDQLAMYKSKKNWEDGDDTVNSCFIKSSVLEFPKIKEKKYTYSLFSHEKQGISTSYFNNLDIFHLNNFEDYYGWVAALEKVINENDIEVGTYQQRHSRIINPNMQRNSIYFETENVNKK